MSETTKPQGGWRANKWVRAAIPALLLHCSIGTVYCWGTFSKEIAEYIGAEKSAVQWAFSLAIFFLGMSAAFLGDVVENPEVAVAILTIPDDAVFNLGDILQVIEANNGAYVIEKKSGELNYTAKYASDPAIVKNCWSMLGFEILAYIAIATGALEFIDKDKR